MNDMGCGSRRTFSLCVMTVKIYHKTNPDRAKSLQVYIKFKIPRFTNVRMGLMMLQNTEYRTQGNVNHLVCPPESWVFTKMFTHYYGNAYCIDW